MSKINFYVRDEEEGKDIPVSYDSSITVKDFILDFTRNHTSFAAADPKVYTFLTGAKILNSKRYIDRQLKELIQEKNVVKFRRQKTMHYSGGPGILTVDVSKDITKEYEPAQSGPSYQTGCNGLTIQSTCKNENCIAYNKTVFIPIGYVNNWNLFEHLEEDVLCPSCKEMVNAKNYWLKNCFYRIDYIKNNNEKMERGSIRGDASSDMYKTFDQEESGEALFVKLVFNVEKR